MSEGITTEAELEACGGTIFLTGFMGSGKSEVGRRLAEKLGRRFIDLDREIEAAAGKTIPEIFEDENESGFRRRESDALRVVTAATDRPVVATGGGIVTAEDNRRAMAEAGTVVWLNPSFDTLLGRMDDEARAVRPLFEDEQQARTLWAERTPLYESADLELPVGEDETAEETADRLLTLLEKALLDESPLGKEAPCDT